MPVDTPWGDSPQKDSSRHLHRTGGSSVRGVTVHPIGGLGNQMFIYATGLALSLDMGCDLLINDDWFDTQQKRAFELDAIAHRGSLVHGSTKPKKQVAARAMAWLRGHGLALADPRRGGYFAERSFAYDRRILDISQDVDLYGYFQSWKYFQHHADQVRHDVTSILSPSPWYLETREALGRMPGFTAVHVRRGDYLHPGTREYHGLAGIEYYQRALALVDSRVGEQAIVLFSDETDLALQIFDSLGRECLPIVVPPESRPIESINLMSLGTAAVIANSSFSWWGAWLGEEHMGIVVAPRPWFDDPATTERDLLRPSWVTVGR